MDPALGFWCALGAAYVATIVASQIVVGLIAHPVLYNKIKREYQGRIPDLVAQDEAEEPEGGGRWLGFWIGFVETTGYFLLFVFDVAGAGGFVAGWIGLKMATGWHRIAQGRRYYLRMSMAALTLNVLNVLFAVGGAQVFFWLWGG
jgi:hypothetical protein